MITAQARVHVKIQCNCSELFKVAPNDLELSQGDVVEIKILMRRMVAARALREARFKVLETQMGPAAGQVVVATLVRVHSVASVLVHDDMWMT